MYEIDLGFQANGLHCVEAVCEPVLSLVHIHEVVSYKLPSKHFVLYTSSSLALFN